MSLLESGKLDTAVRPISPSRLSRLDPSPSIAGVAERYAARIAGGQAGEGGSFMHVSDEDLELYLLARLPSHRLSAVESHLSSCGTCAGKLGSVAETTFRIFSLGHRQLGDYGGPEKRREHRIPSEAPGQMRPLGLKVRTPQLVSRGTIVQVRVSEAIILGEVRYCVEVGTEFDAGIQIQDVVPIHKVQPGK